MSIHSNEYIWRRSRWGPSKKVFHLFPVWPGGHTDLNPACGSAFDDFYGPVTDYPDHPADTRECRGCRKVLDAVTREKGREPVCDARGIVSWPDPSRPPPLPPSAERSHGWDYRRAR
jgi:hypothetical protein